MRRHQKRKNQPEEESNERWLVSYADFITLLFAFFVVLYATSERNSQKTQEFEKSIKKFLVKVGGSISGPGSKINEGEKNNTPIAPPIPTFKTSSNEANEVISEIEVFLEERVPESKRGKYIIDLSHDIYGVRLSLNASQVFTENTVLFEAESLKTVDTILYLISKLANKVIVESYVDKKASRPEPFKNDWNLSAMRSAQVVNYMIKKHNIDPLRLAVMGHGSERPIYPNDSAAKNKNQRLEFLILTEESSF